MWAFRARWYCGLKGRPTCRRRHRHRTASELITDMVAVLSEDSCSRDIRKPKKYMLVTLTCVATFRRLPDAPPHPTISSTAPHPSISHTHPTYYRRILNQTNMILSQYRNPPYRTPTPKPDTLSPPPGPSTTSPKRKRPASSSGSAAPPALRVETRQDASAGAPLPGIDSPRTKVAERFKTLDLRQSPPDDVNLPAQRKRLKRNKHLGDTVIEDSFDAGDDLATVQSSNQPTVYGNPGVGPMEIKETPTARWRMSSPSPRRPKMANEQPTHTGSLTVVVRREPKRRLLSPPPPPSTSNINSSEPILSPASISSDSSPDQATLTWQEDEITGHDIDPNSLDDDGEGINGIGFRPTPATAYARDQRRKQQVSDWRAREAREARQKRFERRRGGGGGTRSDNSTTKRTVRFRGFG